MRKTGIYWTENRPARIRTGFYNILRERPSPVRSFRSTTPQDALRFFITRNIIHEVIQCRNLESCRVAAARVKSGKN